MSKTKKDKGSLPALKIGNDKDGKKHNGLIGTCFCADICVEQQGWFDSPGYKK